MGPSNAMLTENSPPQLRPSEQPAYPIPDNAATFVADITIPDGLQMRPYHGFDETWRIRFSGAMAWVWRLLARQGSPTGHGVPTFPRCVKIFDALQGDARDITVPVEAQPLSVA